MAKIQNLAVDTIKIAENAVTGVVSSTSSVVVPNASGAPILLVGAVSGNWSPGSGTPPPSMGIHIEVTRSRGGLTVISRTIALGDGDGGIFTVSDAALDHDASTSETYTLDVGVSPVGGSGSGSGTISAYYIKR